jgi:hypothetical protein
MSMNLKKIDLQPLFIMHYGDWRMADGEKGN